MDIIIRKIGDKNNQFVFLPNAKSGFRFSEDFGEPKLSPFQKSCLQLSPQKSKKNGCFWTPNFCYVGMLAADVGGFSLDEILNINEESVKGFNKHFPRKNWYWYSKAKRQNIAVQTFFAGVRVVSGLIVCYYDLMRVGRVSDAHRLYERYLVPTGIARLLETSDSELITEVDRTHNLLMDVGQFVLEAKDEYSVVVATKKQAAAIPPIDALGSPISESAALGIPKEVSGSDTKKLLSDRDVSTRPNLPKITKQGNDLQLSDKVSDDVARKKNPFIMSKVGKS